MLVTVLVIAGKVIVSVTFVVLEHPVSINPEMTSDITVNEGHLLIPCSVYYISSEYNPHKSQGQQTVKAILFI